MMRPWINLSAHLAVIRRERRKQGHGRLEFMVAQRGKGFDRRLLKPVKREGKKR